MVSISTPLPLMKSLKKAGKKFTYEQTTSKMIIRCSYGDFKYEEKDLPMSDVFIIQMVKRAAQKVDLKTVPVINKKEIKYFNTGKATGEFKNCYEVDLSGAYWEMAREWLPDKVYKRGLQVSKEARLYALGALAKVTIKGAFDGRRFESDKQKCYQAQTKDLFFGSAKAVGEIMDRLLQLCDGALFFWVDAIFTTSRRDLLMIQHELAKMGLNHKYYKCEKIIADEEKITVFSKQHDKSHPQRR